MASAPMRPSRRLLRGSTRPRAGPSFNPLIAHVGDLEAARQIARFDAHATQLAEAFWPGPLTLVLPKTARLPGRRTRHRRARHRRDPRSRPPGRARPFCGAFGGPVVAPSANLSGHVSPTTAAHVQSDLAGRIDLIVDGGAVEVGVESTIIGCFDKPMLLRPGGLPRGGDRARARPRPCRGCPRMPVATPPSRWRRACWPRIMRRARRCGSMPTALRPARRCWRSVAARCREPMKRRCGDEFVRSGRSQ